jgi:glycogen operon protein
MFLNICRLNAFRKKHPVFNSLELFTGEKAENGAKDITWLRPDAQEMEGQDWQTPYAKTLAYMLNGKSKQAGGKDDDFLVMMSGDDYYTVDYQLPKPPSGGEWKLVFDSSRQGFVNEEQDFKAGDKYALKPFSYVILSHKNSKNNGRVLQKQQAQILKGEGR